MKLPEMLKLKQDFRQTQHKIYFLKNAEIEDLGPVVQNIISLKNINVFVIFTFEILMKR